MNFLNHNTDKKFNVLAFQGYGIELLPVTSCDLLSLRRWRNSQQIRQNMTNNSYVSPRQQRIWFENIQGRVDQMNWVVWCKGIRSGFINIKGSGPLDLQKQLGGGYYVGESQARHGLLGYAIFLMFHDIIFEHFLVSEIRDTVLKSNFRARKMNKIFGYFEGEEFDKFIKISLIYSRYKTAKIKIARYFGDDSSCKLIPTEKVENMLKKHNL